MILNRIMFDTNDILWVAYNKVNGLMFKGTEVFPPYTVSIYLFLRLILMCYF